MSSKHQSTTTNEVALAKRKRWDFFLFGGRFIRPDSEAANTGVEITFFNNLPVGQVLSNVYLPEEISTCPKKNWHNKF